MRGFLGFACALWLVGCWNPFRELQEPEPLCAPGKQVSCVCPGSVTGAQACSSDGTQWGPCQCQVAKLKFGQAVEAVRGGKRVVRMGCDGVSMSLHLGIPHGKIPDGVTCEDGREVGSSLVPFVVMEELNQMTRYLGREPFSVGGVGCGKFEDHWEDTFRKKAPAEDAQKPCRSIVCDECGVVMYCTDGVSTQDAPNGDRIKPVVVTIGDRRMLFCGRACVVEWVLKKSDKELCTGYPLF